MPILFTVLFPSILSEDWIRS